MAIDITTEWPEGFTTTPEPETYSRKTHNGWQSETEWQLPNGFFLRLRTAKAFGSGRLQSAYVVQRRERPFVEIRIGVDYYETIYSVDARVTERAVEAQHAKALRYRFDVAASVVKHYAKLGEIWGDAK